MSNRALKWTRILISLFFFLFISFIFIDFGNNVSEETINKILYLQFFPSLLKFIKTLSFAALGFAIVIILTALFGRVYCSYLCPLGVLQDIIIFIKGRFTRNGYRFRFKKALNILRYTILGILIIFLFTGSIFFINLLDPYSIFGRFSADLFRPLYVGLNNLSVSILEHFEIYYFYPYELKKLSLSLLWLPASFFILITGLSLISGRLYCNTVCPVGTLLGLLSRISVFKIRIDKTICTKCGKCMFVCKANCINIKEQKVDFSRCVGCYNCIATCPEDAINYRHTNNKKQEIATSETDYKKRQFLLNTFLFIGGLFGFKSIAQDYPYQSNQDKNKPIPVKRNHPITPPGSLNIEHFKNACTACHLCVNACPTDVLQPVLFDYGLSGMLQPKMDYFASYCNYSCTVCSEVCPTGAILPITEKEKKTTQIGIAQFLKQNCIVYKDNTACGACAEHCPTTAVTMVPYGDGLKIPEMRPEICIGCGACEYACPAEPHKAIYVKSNTDHQLAKEPPKEESLKAPDEEEDFPF